MYFKTGWIHFEATLSLTRIDTSQVTFTTRIDTSQVTFTCTFTFRRSRLLAISQVKSNTTYLNNRQPITGSLTWWLDINFSQKSFYFISFRPTAFTGKVFTAFAGVPNEMVRTEIDLVTIVRVVALAALSLLAIHTTSPRPPAAVVEQPVQQLSPQLERVRTAQPTPDNWKEILYLSSIYVLKDR